MVYGAIALATETSYAGFVVLSCLEELAELQQEEEGGGINSKIDRPLVIHQSTPRESRSSPYLPSRASLSAKTTALSRPIHGCPLRPETGTRARGSFFGSGCRDLEDGEGGSGARIIRVCVGVCVHGLARSLCSRGAKGCWLCCAVLWVGQAREGRAVRCMHVWLWRE